MGIINNIKNIFMPIATKSKKVEVETETNAVVNAGPKGFNETTGKPLTKESFEAYIENMKENEPEKYAKKKDELEKKLAELSK